MIALDIRTILFGYVLTNIVSTIVIIELWHQNRRRLNGASLWVADYILVTISLFLIILRGTVPDWISIDLSNTLVIIGTLLGLMALERFTDKRGIHLHNYILVVAFFLVHLWFTFVEPDLAFRTLNLAVAMFIICFQYAFLIFYRASRDMRKMTFGVGVVFSLYCLINIARVGEFFIRDRSITNFFLSNEFDALALISYQILFILLTYNLALMFNKSLLVSIASEEEKFSKAFHSSPYAVILTRLTDGKIFEANRGFQKIYGYLSSEILGKSTLDIGIWDNEADRLWVVGELLNGRVIKEKEFLFRSKNGNSITGLMSAEVFILKNEKCIISSINDISKRKKAEEALYESEARLKELNATKDKFFSIIAHDLKNPFNAIIGFSNLLTEQIQKKDQDGIEEYVSIIRNSSQRAMDLLTNLLEWSRSQTGRMEFNPEYIELVALINHVTELTDAAAGQKSIAIKKELPHNINVFADKAMLSTILRNLISNAIKFTNSGGFIVISARQNQNDITVTISDSGVGIAADGIKKLFRIDESFSTIGTQNETGTGLGLLICKEFVQKHGGKIRAESKPGKGSIFSFTIPVS